MIADCFLVQHKEKAIVRSLNRRTHVALFPFSFYMTFTKIATFEKLSICIFEGNTEVWLKVGSPVAFVEAGGEVYKD